MLYELAYPGLCLAELAQRLGRRRRLSGKPFTYRAERSRLQRRELALLAGISLPAAARLALYRFEAARPRPDETVAQSRRRGGRARRRDGVDGSLVERHFGTGQGPRVLLLHGWTARSAMMWPLAQALAARGARVTVPDLPGEGDNPAAVLSFTQKARILAQSYHAQPFDIVVGHSAGGLIAAQAIEQGLCARHLVTICTPLSMATLLHAYLHRIDAPPALLDALMALYERREGRSAHLVGPPVYVAHAGCMTLVQARFDWQVRLPEAEAIAELTGVAPVVLDGCNHHSILTDSRLHDCLAGLLEHGAGAATRQVQC
ncbi:MAG: alpha/beta fold hydrolase [Sphingomonadales bacterium]|nr:alpha/beta fold hydrolase [Sphingomonadales bacterium]